MKKKIFLLILMFVISLISCTKENYNSDQESENEKKVDPIINPDEEEDEDEKEELVDLEILIDETYLEIGKSYSYSIKDNIEATLSSDSKNVIINNNSITLNVEEKVTLTATYKKQTVTKEVYGISRTKEINSLPRDSYYLNYFGRNVFEPEKVIMNNGGNGFEVSFYGTELYATMDAWYGSWYGKTKISVMVDGNTDYSKKKSIVTMLKGTTKYEYKLISGLDEGYHTVKVYKRTEGISTDLSLYGVRTDGYFLPVSKDEKLKIEVYGDSITAGYGNLRGNLADTTNNEYQNAMETYAGYLVNLLDADVNMMARTGIGLYTAESIQDGNNVIDLYGKTSYEGTYNWNFDNFTPDIVLINLGTNDNWNTQKFNADTFVDNYCNFIRDLAEIYGPDTSFILLSGFMETDVKEYLEYVIYYLTDEIENSIYQFTFDKCAGGHPLNTEHYEAAESLVSFIKENNLDVIHYQKDEYYEEAKGEIVNYSLKIETGDEIGDYISLYVCGLTASPAKLTKIDNFDYSINLELTEGDYDFTVIADNNEEYESIGIYTSHVRITNSNETIFINSFNNLPIDPNPNADTFGWVTSKHLFTLSINPKEDELEYYNENWMAGFAYHQATLKDNYTYSLNIKGDYLDTIDQVFAGFCPYYIDDHNYVVIYLQWNADGKFKSFGCTGKSQGTDIGWNDYWSFANLTVDLTQGVDIKVSRSGTSLTIEMLGVTETKSLACMTTLSNYYAVWGVKSHMTVTNILQEAIE